MPLENRCLQRGPRPSAPQGAWGGGLPRWAEKLAKEKTKAMEAAVDRLGYGGARPRLQGGGCRPMASWPWVGKTMTVSSVQTVSPKVASIAGVLWPSWKARGTRKVEKVLLGRGGGKGLGCGLHLLWGLGGSQWFFMQGARTRAHIGDPLGCGAGGSSGPSCHPCGLGPRGEAEALTLGSRLVRPRRRKRCGRSGWILGHTCPGRPLWAVGGTEGSQLLLVPAEDLSKLAQLLTGGL